ncbi:MAG TPA: RIO1 family regulatory kinase/ATPase, partial [Aggregatilineales bacterium]|nr:RIO1 family regulatory kinase/ATPase [Aggregatilineales bacterium]
HEFATLSRLYEAGAAVPQPIAAGDNAILMGYVGDGQMAAPLLNDVRLDSDEALRLFSEVLRNLDLMLEFDMIHGDLSAYNILYWEGRITIIDFPQVTNSRTNSNAHFILQRDIERICDYFQRQGVRSDPDAVFRRLLNAHPRGFYYAEPIDPEE